MPLFVLFSKFSSYILPHSLYLSLLSPIPFHPNSIYIFSLSLLCRPFPTLAPPTPSLFLISVARMCLAAISSSLLKWATSWPNRQRTEKEEKMKLAKDIHVSLSTVILSLWHRLSCIMPIHSKFSCFTFMSNVLYSWALKKPRRRQWERRDEKIKTIIRVIAVRVRQTYSTWRMYYTRDHREDNEKGEMRREKRSQNGLYSYLRTVLQQKQHPLHHVARVIVDLLLQYMLYVHVTNRVKISHNYPFRLHAMPNKR